MQKLKSVFLAALFLCVASTVFVVFYLGRAVKTGIETFGPALTGAPVKVRSVLLSPLSGRGRVRGFTLGNPPGYKTDYAVRVRSVKVDVDLGSLRTGTWVVRRVVVDGPEITYERGLTGSNISKIQENVERFVPSGGGGSKSAAGPKIIIRDFIVKDGRIRLSAKLLAGSALPVSMPDIHLRDIGVREGGASLKDAANEVMGTLSASVTRAASGGMHEKAKQGLENLKKLFGR